MTAHGPSAWLAAAWLSLMVVGGLPAQADPAARAAALYDSGRHEEAHAAFTALLADPAHDRADAHFGLGNCAFRLGRHAEAILHYRAAHRLRPRDGEVWWNLRLTEQHLGVGDRAPESLAAVVLGLLRSFTETELLALAVILQSAGLLGLLFAGGHRRQRRLCWGALLLGILLGAAGLHRRWLAPQEGVVLAPAAAVRGEPHRSLPARFELQAGERVTVHEHSDRWARVGSAQGGGWVEREALGLVD